LKITPLQEQRIVFFDIDGCLTSIEDGSSFLLMNPDSYRISESRLELFLNFLEKSDANVVISSNWRRFPDDGYWIATETVRFKNHLPELKSILGKRYIGDLPHDRHISKSEALVLWGEFNDIDFKNLNYVIIDDDEREGFKNVYEFRKHYIHCDAHTGITETQCQEAFEILTNDANRKTIYY